MIIFDTAAALKSNSQKIESVLEEYLSPERIGEGKLGEAMRYAVLGGGKRIRAYLVAATGEIFGASFEMCAPFAAAIEMIHAYSLIHDDLPCMDDDDIRRGKPSCHKKFGEATALLAGDALLSEAFATVASNDKVSPLSVAKVCREYGTLSGIIGMAGGQETDLAGDFDTYEKLCEMYAKKTGGLIWASVFAGYLASTDSPDEKIVEKLKTYAYSLALAFQIQDDVLDVESDTATLGKPVGSDDKNDKHTSIAYMGLAEAKTEYRRLTEVAVEALEGIDGADALASLADFLCSRKY